LSLSTQRIQISVVKTTLVKRNNQKESLRDEEACFKAIINNLNTSYLHLYKWVRKLIDFNGAKALILDFS